VNYWVGFSGSSGLLIQAAAGKGTAGVLAGELLWIDAWAASRTAALPARIALAYP
jgi:hypothetical protein